MVCISQSRAGFVAKGILVYHLFLSHPHVLRGHAQIEPDGFRPPIRSTVTSAALMLAAVLASWNTARLRADPSSCPTTTWPAPCLDQPAFLLANFCPVSERLFAIPATAQATQSRIGGIVLLDADLDCDLDVLTLTSDRRTLGNHDEKARLILSDNDCFGNFSVHAGFRLEGQAAPYRMDLPIELAAANLTDNGYPDVVALISHTESQPNQTADPIARVIVCRNRGDASTSVADRFMDVTTNTDVYDLQVGAPVIGAYITPAIGVDIDCADLDQDGDIDIAVLGYAEEYDIPVRPYDAVNRRHHVWVLWNRGDDNQSAYGDFPSITRYEITPEDHTGMKEQPLQIACGDLNNDAGTNGVDIAVAFTVLHPEIARHLRAYLNHGQSGGGSGGGHADGERFSFALASDGSPLDDNGAYLNELVIAQLHAPASQPAFPDMAAPYYASGGSLDVYVNPADSTTNVIESVATTQPAGPFPTDAAAADMDRDGLLDLITCSPLSPLGPAAVTVLRNGLDGVPGALGPGIPDYAASVDVHKLAVGDVNGDGCLDVVRVGNGDPFFPYGLANADKRWISVFYGDCSGALRQQYQVIVPFNPCVDVDFGELNGDRLPDVIVAQTSSHTDEHDADLRLYLQNPDHTLTQALYTLLPSGSVSAAAADFDPATGHYDDIAIVHLATASADTQLRILFNDGSSPLSFTAVGSGFVTNGTTTAFNITSIVAGDVTTDGVPDLVMTDNTSPGRFWVVANDGTGDFLFDNGQFPGQEVVLFDASSNGTSGPRALCLLDANTDGMLDVAVACEDPSVLAVMVNRGGYFSGAAPDNTYPVGSHPVSVAAGRLNEDDLPDLATANYRGDSVTVLLGSWSAAGTFDATTNCAVAQGPKGITICDVNGDCLDDLAVISDGPLNGAGFGGVITILLNDPASPGTFDLPPITLPGGWAPAAITSGDLDRRCGPDIADVGAKDPTSGHQSTLFVTHTGGLWARGDFNADCAVDGCDIQGFVNTYFSPDAASRRDYYAADMDGDDGISQADWTFFADALVNETRYGVSSYCSADGGAGERGVGPFAANAASTTLSAEPMERLRALRAWESANPPSAYPAWSAFAYAAERMRVMAGLGIIDPGAAAASIRYYAWREQNPPAAFPTWTHAEYARMCVDMMFELGVLRHSSEGGAP